MNALLIEETKGTPKVRFYTSGEMLIEGHSLPADPTRFYRPLLDWVKNCSIVTIILDIRLIYLNTSSSKELRTFFKLIKENPNIKSVTVNWHYEEGDDDSYDTGREFESFVNIPFRFHEYAEVFD